MLAERITDRSDVFLPLTEEHAVLLHEVRRRVRAVRGALGGGRWPDRELDELLDYLRYEVLDQASNEESLLFPLTADGLESSRMHGLIDDHAQIRDLADRLATGRAGGEPSEPQALIDLLDDLEELLDGHMRREQRVLGTATSDGVESHRHPFRRHLWFPLLEGPDVDLDAVPPAYAHRAALDRFSRLRPGERLLVTSSSDLESLWNLLAFAHPGDFGWRCLEEGPERWRVEVTRRPDC
jgi:uncharacterized protein (DUF2249 family)